MYGWTPATMSVCVARRTLLTRALRDECRDCGVWVVVSIADLRSEPLRQSCQLDWVWLVGAWYFAAETRGGIDFVGVAEVVGIDGTTNQLVGGEVGFGEHDKHVLFLFHAYAVLAGDAATVGDATANDFTGEFIGIVLLAGDALIVEHEWMEIAITSVEDIGD